MIKVIVNGCHGRMGQVVCELAQKNEEFDLLGGVDQKEDLKSPFPIYQDPFQIPEKPDVIIDFSIPKATFGIASYAMQNQIPMVIATTGFSEEEKKEIQKISKTIPIFQSANMSYDIHLLKHLLLWLTPKLKGTDVEITETHHNQKIDSPSGTAQLFADTINSVLDNQYHCEYNRHDKREKRDKFEIGMSSIRGGNIVGEHMIQFFGEFETFEIKHTTYSRNVFAEGALKAAAFLVQQKTGYYTMDDLCQS